MNPIKNNAKPYKFKTIMVLCTYLRLKGFLKTLQNRRWYSRHVCDANNIILNEIQSLK